MNQKLDKATVRQIRHEWISNTKTAAELADEHGTSLSNLYSILGNHSHADAHYHHELKTKGRHELSPAQLAIADHFRQRWHWSYPQICEELRESYGKTVAESTLRNELSKYIEQNVIFRKRIQ